MTGSGKKKVALFPEVRARRAVNTVMATRLGHRLVDRSAEFETPPASGSPTACVIPGLGVHADLTRGMIPLVVTRLQRYFFNRLKLENGGPGARYRWNYNDDVPDPGVENTSHANLDMFYLDVLRRSRERLNAHVAPVGEPIMLNDAIVRRFANTFLQQIARPAEIDRGGNVRGNVAGDPTEPDEKGKTDRFNYSLDGWVTLAVADATVYRLCRDILLRTSTRVGQPGIFQEYLGAGTHAALLANKR